MGKHSTPTLRCGVACLALLVAGQAGADKPERLQRFQEQTVMITVTRPDQSVEHGAGIVMCQEDHRAYVLTSSHLFVATMPEGRKVLRYPARTEIRFFDDGIPSFVDDRAAPEQVLTIHQVPEDDLVLLTFPFESLLNTAAMRQGFFEVSTVLRGSKPVVFAVGHPSSSTETWVHQQGTLLPGGGRLLHHSAPIDEGFIGGPLFNKRWLIGINLRRVPGEEIGAEAGTLFGEALSVKQILPAIDRWLLPGCRYLLELRVDAFLQSTASVARVAEATAMEVQGRSSFDEKLRFGSCWVTRVHRGSIETLSSRWRQTYEFSFKDTQGSLWAGKCILRAEQTDPDPDWEIRLDLSRSADLTCEFKQPDSVTSERIVIRELFGPDRDTVPAGVVQIDVVSIRLNPAWKRPPEMPADYLFYFDDQLIGAVATTADGTVWLYPSATGKIQSAFLIASAAILLHPNSDS